MNEYLKVVRHNYANFSGRARRREYWMFTLVNALILLVLMLPYAIFGSGESVQATGAAARRDNLLMAPFMIYWLLMFLPTLAVAARRLQDTGRSALWLLLNIFPLTSIVPLIFLMLDSQPGQNRWGPNPKGQAAVTAAADNW